MKKEELISFAIKRILSPSFVRLSKNQKYSRLEKVRLKWNQILRVLLPLGSSSEGNRVKIFSKGLDAQESIEKSINEAKRKIEMETYIFKTDESGKRILECLANAAKRGVDVTLLYDGFGAINLTQNDLVDITSNGGKCVVFNPLFNYTWRSNPKYSLLLRDHRKILIIDDEHGYCGGMNIANEYFGLKSENLLTEGVIFRDTHLKLTGPCVAHLKEVFEESLDDAHKGHGTSMTRKIKDSIKTLPNKFKSWNHFYESFSATSENWTKAIAENYNEIKEVLKTDLTENEKNGKLVNDEDTFIQILPSNLLRNKKHIQKALNCSIINATEYVYLTTPFFLPPKGLMDAIITAAKNGVKVIILTSGPNSDVPASRYASQHIYHKFLKNGVKIYEYEANTLHAKTVAIDDIYSMVGTFNLDFLSGMKLLEVNVSMLNSKATEDLKNQFLEDLKSSREINLKSLKKRSI
eukprot:gene5611-9428_t